jgi:hypothetical protein
MAFLDALTGGAGQQAAIQQQGAIASIYPSLIGANDQSHNLADQYLRQGFGNAGTNLGTGYGASTGAINTGANSAQGFLGQGTQGALGQLGQARDALTANGGAYSPLTALAGQYGKGAGLYADSLGINGAQGNQNAVNAFQTGPGYEFARNQGIDAITRAANASGGLGGNSLKDTITYGQGLANQEYGNWQNKLAPYNQLQLGATQSAAAGNQAINSGVANTYGAGAQLLDSSGRAQAGVATGQGNSLSDLARQYYGGLAGNDINQGSALGANENNRSANFINTTQGALGQYNDTYKQQANAANAASKNQIDLAQNLAKLLVGSAAGGGLSGAGGIFGSGSGAASLSDPTFGGFSLPGQNAASVKF